MVVPPPWADLRHPADRWQTVFAPTALLAEKSMQNADRCDIEATVSAQADDFLPIGRVFLATPVTARAAAPNFWVVGWKAAERL
jgi:hypothetical protein